MFRGSITAMITPFCEQGETIDWKAFRELLRAQKVSDGVVVAGSTGEGSCCSEAEIDELTKVALEELGDRISVLVGTGTNCTKTTIAKTKRAKELGADGALVIVPYYNKPSERGVILHFEEVAKVGLPLIVYYSPSRTGLTLSSQTLGAISRIKGVVGIKETTGDLRVCKAVLQENRNAVLLTGNDDNLIEFMKAGGKGSLVVMNNLLPEKWKEIVDLAQAGNYEKADLLYKEIFPLIQAVYSEINPQGIKCALSLLGKCNNELRLPLVPVMKETEERIKRGMTPHFLMSCC